jgi:hypothetical protein
LYIAASEGSISAEDIIENRLQDRPAKNEAAKSGRRDIMSVDSFKNAVRACANNECAATVSDLRDMLLDAKSKDMLLRGKDPALVSVCTKTVREYEQFLGGDADLQVRPKISKKTHARVPDCV